MYKTETYPAQLGKRSGTRQGQSIHRCTFQQLVVMKELANLQDSTTQGRETLHASYW